MSRVEAASGDVVVTVPMRLWGPWIEEGDPVGAPASGEEWGFYLRQPPPRMEPGDRVYVVAHGQLRGYAPLVRIAQHDGATVLVRQGGAVAVTIDEQIKGFRGYRYRWWPRELERAFPTWRTAGVPIPNWTRADLAATSAAAR